MVLPYLKGSSLYIFGVAHGECLDIFGVKGLTLNFYGGFSLILKFYYKISHCFLSQYYIEHSTTTITLKLAFVTT